MDTSLHLAYSHRALFETLESTCPLAVAMLRASLKHLWPRASIFTSMPRAPSLASRVTHPHRLPSYLPTHPSSHYYCTSTSTSSTSPNTTASAPAPKPARRRAPPLKPDNNNFVRLVQVSSDKNSNKFYEMKQLDKDTFAAVWGRVGSAGQSSTFQMWQWNEKYMAKTRDGYEDHSHLIDAEDISIEKEEEKPKEVKPEVDLTVLDEGRRRVCDLLAQLQKMTAEHVAVNYKVAPRATTLKQVNEAQKVLDNIAGKDVPRLETATTVEEQEPIIKDINDQLLKLFAILPRRMSKVSKYLIQPPKDGGTALYSMADIAALVSSEQATLDAMRTQVEIAIQTKKEEKKAKEAAKEKKIDHAPVEKPSAEEHHDRLLRQISCQMSPVTDPTEIKNIKALMDENRYYFREAFRVTNEKTQPIFDEHMSKSKDATRRLFWHGSRSENWLSILTSGLQCNPANAIINGKMFGYGIYFADRFEKSLGYTSINSSYWALGTSSIGYLAIFEVHVGSQYVVHESLPNMTATSLRTYGEYDSVFAKKKPGFLFNNEFIVYDQAQCTIKYLVRVATKGHD
eukprot:TRINITY_DN891_c1_g1_i3.p1 TRINITY_DN891_c1_g1~~TRINITY_DN891_c1_g1_i3.p1  ORF type:complete len:569 (-),score=156.00 TRINITY_DN891_c1_g1_i3:158-1864(-)